MTRPRRTDRRCAAHAVAVSNATVGLELALRAVGVKAGDEVITVSHSYIATANSIRYCGAEPVFVDVDRDTHNMDPVLIEAAITSKTKAILLVHQMGMPADLSGIVAVGRKHRLKIIEDAACAIGSEYLWEGEWEKVGRCRGDAAVFSFHPRKVMSTGDGGMITTPHTDWNAKFKLLRQHGMSVPDTVRHGSNQVIFESHPVLGYNYRMNDMAGAIGLSRLDRLPQQTAQRRINAGKYDKILAGIDGLIAPSITAGAEAVYHLYVLQLAPGKFACTRDDFANALKAEGVPTAVHYPRSLPNQPALAEFSNDDTPVADGLASRVLALPMHHDLTDDHIRVVGEALNKVAEAYRL
jgi:dTDP-4-amino-4,6-dideoxygalactose transaminase